jgi:hypothetical protein
MFKSFTKIYSFYLGLRLILKDLDDFFVTVTNFSSKYEIKSKRKVKDLDEFLVEVTNF